MVFASALLLGNNVPKVLVFTTDGDFLMSWNTTTLEMPHGMFLADAASSNPTVWITDVGSGPYGHCIKQYSSSGKLLQVTVLSRICFGTLVLGFTRVFSIRLFSVNCRIGKAKSCKCK